MPFPFDFCVKGPPLSQQAKGKSKQRWKATVRGEAAKYWPTEETPADHPVAARITYYYEGAPLDVDNMVKPILDALCGLVYVDDVQITDAHARKRDINGSFKVRGLSPRLADAFSASHEFVHVEIFLPPDQQDLG